MIIREAGPGDAPALALLNVTVQSLHREARPDLFKEPALSQAVQWFGEMVAKPGVWCWIAEEGARPIGYALAIIREKSETPFTVPQRSLEIDQIAVVEDYRRKGAARQLFESVQALAHREALPEITLKTWAFNRDARHAFERLGLQEAVVQFASPRRSTDAPRGESPDRATVYHRRGEPGGPGCPVTTLDVQMASSSGEAEAATLLDAGLAGSEIQLLRTIVHSLGISWGEDGRGWWAAIPRRLSDA